MAAPRYARLFLHLSRPTLRPHHPAFEPSQPPAELDLVVALIDQIRSATRRCPHCQGERAHRHGHANNLQRFRCRKCRRTFNDLTGTPLARLRLRGKWPDYLQAAHQALSVRAAAALTGVHPNTAFRWRHRFLDQAGLDRIHQLAGMADADALFLLEFQQQARLLDRAAR